MRKSELLFALHTILRRATIITPGDRQAKWSNVKCVVKCVGSQQLHTLLHSYIISTQAGATACMCGAEMTFCDSTFGSYSKLWNRKIRFMQLPKQLPKPRRRGEKKRILIFFYFIIIITYCNKRLAKCSWRLVAARRQRPHRINFKLFEFLNCAPAIVWLCDNFTSGECTIIVAVLLMVSAAISTTSTTFT